MSAVVLFDIDGTLVHAAGAGRRALERAMEEHLGDAVRPEEAWLAGMKLDGMTDRLIVREAVVALGLAFDEDVCTRILATYVRHLESEILGPGYRVLPGVREALARLGARGATVGLCTGNVAGGARVKLGRGGLDGFFDWSGRGVYGFAEDGEARERILEAALARASARLGRRVDPREALVVGDTPRDVSAAHAAGVPVLAVATGRFGVAELSAEGAEHVAATLEAPEALAALLAP